MTKIGTMVVADDGYSLTLGQVVDHETNRWGTFHVVLISGKFDQVATISPIGTRGIGWRVASECEIAHANRERVA